MAKKKKRSEHLANFNIAGFTYYDGPEAFSELKIGTQLQIELEKDNAYDARAVLIQFKHLKLGYIPREHNRLFYKLLTVGIDQIVMRVQRIDANAHPEEQIGVVAHLVEK